MISPADKERIAQAIGAAEEKTAGEIFCVLARHSSEYAFVPFAWAAGIALVIPAPLIYLTLWPAWLIYTIQVVAFMLAALVVSIPNIRFALVPRGTAHDRAHAQAVRQFLAQGLHQTEQRTGVLIFASLAERYAEIVADNGINAKVMPEVWDRAIAALIAEMKQGRVAEGFIVAIQQCGVVLAQHFPPGTLDRDELPNKLVEI